MPSLRVKLFQDGADLASMIAARDCGLVSGYTTNPTLMRKAGITDYKGFARQVIAAIPDKVMAKLNSQIPAGRPGRPDGSSNVRCVSHCAVPSATCACSICAACAFVAGSASRKMSSASARAQRTRSGESAVAGTGTAGCMCDKRINGSERGHKRGTRARVAGAR